MVALTATADEATCSDMLHRLELQDPFIHTASFRIGPISATAWWRSSRRRSNCCAMCRARRQLWHRLPLQPHRREEVAERLSRHGCKAAPYHAGLPLELRQQTQEAFLKDDIEIVVATVAFGMGIDKPNVRFVVQSTTSPRTSSPTIRRPPRRS